MTSTKEDLHKQLQSLVARVESQAANARELASQLEALKRKIKKIERTETSE